MDLNVKKEIVEKLEAYLELHQMSANEFVKISKVNEGYISNMRNGSFKIGNTEIAAKWFIKVAEAMGFKITKTYWETKPTDQLTRMISALQDAKEYGNTNVLIGETGSGKTHTAQLFAKKHPLDVSIITVGSSDNISDLIDKVLESLNLSQAKTKSKKIRDIVNYYKNRKLEGRTPMIIFDEAEYMKQPALCAMKELYDNLRNVCAIILIGTDQLLANLDKLRKRNKAGIPQFYRRIKFGIKTLPAIDRTFKPFLNDIEDKGLKRFLTHICDNYGELHDVLVAAKREAERTEEELTEQFVRVMLNMPNAA